MNWTITTKDGLEFRLDESEYEVYLKDYQQHGSCMINGNLITKSDFPKFRSPIIREASEVFGLEDGITEDQKVWNINCIRYHRHWLTKNQKVPLTFKHLKKARAIAGNWDINDTIAVLKSDFQRISNELAPSEREYEDTAAWRNRIHRPGFLQAEHDIKAAEQKLLTR